MINPDIKSLKNTVITINNAGGTAFPITYEYENCSGMSHGMTLRDYFAAKAMQGLCVNVEDPHEDNIARTSYSMADAMLKAREED